MNRRAAFTVIELLVVMGVIALLVAIAFPAYSAIRRSQRIKRTAAVVETLATAAQNYQNDYGIYPPAESAPEGPPNRGNRALVACLNQGEEAGGRSAPYLPSAFYVPSAFRDDPKHIKGDVLLDEWERPFIYFDSSVMTDGKSHTYALRPDTPVSPAMDGDRFYNFGRCQVWSCGPNGRNDGGRDRHTKEADDIANFEVED